jgi:hypothetical protein
MTTKHFVALARALADTRPPWTAQVELAQWIEDVKAVSEVCQKSNERFDKGRFVFACNGEVAR